MEQENSLSLQRISSVVDHHGGRCLREGNVGGAKDKGSFKASASWGR